MVGISHNCVVSGRDCVFGYVERYASYNLPVVPLINADSSLIKSKIALSRAKTFFVRCPVPEGKFNIKVFDA